jgi:predicted nicotinamide N-methyase
MRDLKINYPKVMRQEKIAGKVFVIEAIRNLDEAIDLLCDALGEGASEDPFAEDLCPYFGILWPSAVGLSNFLGEHPELVRGKSVLELGAGLGLPSLVARHLGGEVLATDYHPQAEEYFLRNCRHSSVTCTYERLNWRTGARAGEQFDLVLGSDVLYESKHPGEIVLGLMNFLKPGGQIVLADPGRAYQQKFLAAMADHGFEVVREDIKVSGQEIAVFIFRKILLK